MGVYEIRIILSYPDIKCNPFYFSKGRRPMSGGGFFGRFG